MQPVTSAGETDDALVAAVAEDLMGVLSSIPPAERTPERCRPALLGYFERPDHIAVEITSALVDVTAPERGSKPVGMVMRPNTAYGRALLARARREIEAEA